MYLQDLQLNETIKYSWRQFFDFVFLKVPAIYLNKTRHIKFRATRYYYSFIKHEGNVRYTT